MFNESCLGSSPTGLPLVGAAYARMSTELQNERSPEDQVRVCRDRAAADGAVIPDDNVFIDRAVSGTKPDRDALAELKNAAKAKRFTVLYFEDLSQLSRESTHLMAMLKQLVYDGVRVVSVNEGIDSSNESWHVLATILGLQHEQYVQDLGHRGRRGQAGTVLDGLSAGDHCFGYISEPVPGAENGKRGRNRRPRMRVKKSAEMVCWVI
jgi:DNA invertase Pin-like site-specific DNA recombinase